MNSSFNCIFFSFPMGKYVSILRQAGCIFCPEGLCISFFTVLCHRTVEMRDSLPPQLAPQKNWHCKSYNSICVLCHQCSDLQKCVANRGWILPFRVTGQLQSFEDRCSLLFLPQHSAWTVLAYHKVWPICSGTCLLGFADCLSFDINCCFEPFLLSSWQLTPRVLFLIKGLSFG